MIGRNYATKAKNATLADMFGKFYSTKAYLCNLAFFCLDKAGQHNKININP